MPASCGKLLSINVGLPRIYVDPNSSDRKQQVWTTGFFKEPVVGPVEVYPTNLAGDGQADLRVHGGVDKAVLAYAAEHYPSWRDELETPDLPYGAFGENLTIGGLSEEIVCIGDIWQIGDAQLQVSQPRQPCWKLARRWSRPDLPRRVLKHGWSGWYFRVLKTGTIESNQVVELVDRLHVDWTIARCNNAMYRQSEEPTGLLELMGLAELAEAWKRDLA